MWLDPPLDTIFSRALRPTLEYAPPHREYLNLDQLCFRLLSLLAPTRARHPANPVIGRSVVEFTSACKDRRSRNLGRPTLHSLLSMSRIGALRSAAAMAKPCASRHIQPCFKACAPGVSITLVAGRRSGRQGPWTRRDIVCAVAEKANPVDADELGCKVRIDAGVGRRWDGV